MTESLIHIENADVSYNGKQVLHRISWDLRAGEHWAITGENGAGKSTFLKLVRGDIWPDPDDRARRIYCLDDEPQETPLGIKQMIGAVTPELQDRYVRYGFELTGLEVVCSGFTDSVWVYEKPDSAQMNRAYSLMHRLGIDHLRDRSFLSMSQGEQRKVHIARAIVSFPRILVLDEICSGLDILSRKRVLGLLEDIAQAGTCILSASHRTEELIASISHVLVLKEGRIIKSGGREDLNAAGEQAVSRTAPYPYVRGKVRSTGGRYLVRIKNASVYLGDRKVLDNITWQINDDENWAVMGRNGSGKSTLLRLITGELLSALGGEVRWFGGEEFMNTWVVRERIGVVSPQIQAVYDDELTAEDAVLSGYFSSIGLYANVTKAQRSAARELMDSFGIGRLRRKKINLISYGEMRKILIARALVRRPDLLILDEPCNGLDAPSRKDFLLFLEKTARGKTRIILVTHHPDELIPSITHVLELDKGKIICKGRREKR